MMRRQVVSLHHITMNESYLEPGLLQALRLYVVAVVITLPLVRRLFASAFNIDVPLEQFLLLNLPVPLFLVCYTLLPWWQRRLGRFFLPSAIFLIAAQAIVEKFVTLQFLIPPQWRELVMLGFMLRLWLLFQMLLLFIAWQYSLFWVTVVGISVSLLDAALSLPFVVPGDPLYPIFVVIVGGRMVSVTGVGLGLGWAIQRQRAQRKALGEANRKLTEYAATAEQLAASHERNRLARELHDTLAHSLSGVTVQLEAVQALWEVDAASAHKMLEQALQTTRSGLTEARRALQALRASPLEDLGLERAISNLAESVAARASLKLELEVANRLENISPGVELCVYRVAQEALTNVARHAEAETVRVVLDKYDGQLTLMIADDGRGFDSVSVNGGRFGLKGMRERVEMVGGTLSVRSQPQQGTTVKLTIAQG